MEDFNNNVAVITGGASGIGYAVASALAHQGSRIVIADIEQAVLDKACKELHQSGFDVLGVKTDVSDRAQVQALADAAWDHFGQVDIVMHNAGVAVFGAAQDMTHEDWAWTMNVNLWGPIHGVEIFTPRMIKQATPGHIVFTASFAGLVANRELAAYNVSKAAVVALSESLRKDIAQHGIGVSVLCPMRVSSNIDFSARNRPEALGGPEANRTYTDEERAALQGRLLDVEPVAELVLAAIRNNEPYIHTHKEASAYFQKRAARISGAFERAL